ncbi:MAG: DUF2163 domain-containing protein [Parvularculaceae bacterium]|nr:DUF2163 domain-containing protein [Parvularculaceae bacterium]
MRALDPQFAAHLASGVTTLATCWKIARADGAVLGFTDHDRALAFDGVVYAPETGAEGRALQSSADLAVDNTEIAGALTAEALSAEDLLAGRYDGADVEIWRVNWADVASRALLKRGVIGEVTREGERFRAEIRGRSAMLDRVTGRIYQRGCDAVLGDARCGVDLTAPAYRGTGTVTAVLDDQRFLASGLGGFAGGWFAGGALVWTGGENAGARGHLKAHDKNPAGDALSLWFPAGRPISAGDSFSLTAGCDKRAGTCTAKFSNLINFRGFHLMPGDDFAISYPLKAEKNDGGKR